MKSVVILLLWFITLAAQSVDTTLYYRKWQPGLDAVPQPRDSLKPGPFVAVSYHHERPIEVRRFDAQGNLTTIVRSQLDQWGNVLAKRFYDGAGKLVKILQFQVNPDTLRLLSRIMGPDFHPRDRHLLVAITYNRQGREENYSIKSVSGRLIAHRQTSYNAAGLKIEERLIDDLHRRLIILRRYHYDDRTGTVVVKEYDGTGKLRSKIILTRPLAEPLTN